MPAPGNDAFAAEALLHGLGERLGIPGLCLDPSGVCQLDIDHRWRVTISLHPNGDRLLVHCPLSGPDLLPRLDAVTLRMVLAANFLGCATAGGSLAVSPDQRVCLQYAITLPSLRGNVLEQTLERLLDCAQTWSKRLGDAAAQPAEAPLRAVSPGVVRRHI